MADMEDRNRRNNLKIRGIPETVEQGDLLEYATTLFKEILPDLTDLDVIIDRIHRLPKPSYLANQIPRDVILQLHFYHAKEKLMSAMRTKDNIPPQHQNLQSVSRPGSPGSVPHADPGWQKVIAKNAKRH